MGSNLCPHDTEVGQRMPEVLKELQTAPSRAETLRFQPILFHRKQNELELGAT